MQHFPSTFLRKRFVHTSLLGRAGMAAQRFGSMCTAARSHCILYLEPNIKEKIKHEKLNLKIRHVH